jgi:hypothetical protein
MPSGVQSLPEAGRLTVSVYIDDQAAPERTDDVTTQAGTVDIQFDAPEGEHVFTLVFAFDDPDFATPDGKPWEVARWSSDPVQVASGQRLALDLDASQYRYADSNADGQSNLEQLLARTDPGAPPNAAPVAADGDLALDQDAAGAGVLAASDADADPLAFSIVTAPAHGAAAITDARTGAYTYTPEPGFVGTDRFGFKASDGKADSNTALVAVVVNAAPDGFQIPGLIQAEDYNEGGPGIGYFDTTRGNTGRAYRDDDVDIEPTVDEGGGYNVGWIRTGEWLNYDVHVQATGAYTVELRIARDRRGSSRMRVEFDGLDAAGPIEIPNTGNWQRFTTVTVSGVGLSAGPHVMRLFFDEDGELNLNWMKFTLEGAVSASVVETVTSPEGAWASTDGQDVAMLHAGRIAVQAGALVLTGTYAAAAGGGYAGALDVYAADAARLVGGPAAFHARLAAGGLALTLDAPAPQPRALRLVRPPADVRGLDLPQIATTWTYARAPDYRLVLPIGGDGVIEGAADSAGCRYRGRLSPLAGRSDLLGAVLELEGEGCGARRGTGYAGFAMRYPDRRSLRLVVSNGKRSSVIAVTAPAE